MILDFSELGKFTINMERYIDKVMKNSPKEFDWTATMPAAYHLFKTQDSALKLIEHNGNLFHHVTAQLLFRCKQGCPDIHTEVTFLCTRVKMPD